MWLLRMSINEVKSVALLAAGDFNPSKQIYRRKVLNSFIIMRMIKNVAVQ